MTLPSACNFAACILIVVGSLALEAAWNFHAVSTETRYFWQPRLVTLVCACCVVQVWLHYREGGYRHDAEDRRAKGFPVIPNDKDNQP